MQVGGRPQPETQAVEVVQIVLQEDQEEVNQGHPVLETQAVEDVQIILQEVLRAIQTPVVAADQREAQETQETLVLKSSLISRINS